LRMLPSDGAGTRIPTPTKLIPPSTNTAVASERAACTISASTLLGRMCRTRMRSGPAPIAWAAAT